MRKSKQDRSIAQTVTHFLCVYTHSHVHDDHAAQAISTRSRGLSSHATIPYSDYCSNINFFWQQLMKPHCLHNVHANGLDTYFALHEQTM